jgi:predicted TPR repeat methyltransferase
MSKENLTKPFSSYNNYYDLLYSDKDYRAESLYIAELIRASTPNACKILELGSGTGNYATYLTQFGFNVDGIEISEQMASVAKAKAIDNFEVLTGDIRSFQLDDLYDGAIAMFHVISYLTTDNDLKDCFTTVNNHLKTGGLFCFDVWYSPAVNFQKPGKRTKAIKQDDIEIIRVASPVVNTDNTVDVIYEMTVHRDGTSNILRESHKLRHFTTAEIKSFAESTGFELVRAEEIVTAKAPGTDTWGVCYILQKHE